MFDTNDVYNDAVRGSTLHAEDNNDSKESLMGSKIVSALLLAGIAYVGFTYYSKNIENTAKTRDETLVVKDELIAELQTKSETLVVTNSEDSEEDYLSALRAIEKELIEEQKNVDLETHQQMSLSSAMNDIIKDTMLSDNTTYTKQLRKELGIDEVVESKNVVVDKGSKKESRTVVVQKGDTLQGISNKFYGDAMNYKRIIASNDGLHSNDILYEGQTILLPY